MKLAKVKQSSTFYSICFAALLIFMSSCNVSRQEIPQPSSEPAVFTDNSTMTGVPKPSPVPAAFTDSSLMTGKPCSGAWRA